MAKKDSTKPHSDTQAQRFVEAARELGCDDNEDRLKDTLRKIAKAPPAKGSRRRKASTTDESQ